MRLDAITSVIVLAGCATTRGGASGSHGYFREPILEVVAGVSTPADAALRIHVAPDNRRVDVEVQNLDSQEWRLDGDASYVRPFDATAVKLDLPPQERAVFPRPAVPSPVAFVETCDMHATQRARSLALEPGALKHVFIDFVRSDADAIEGKEAVFHLVFRSVDGQRTLVLDTTVDTVGVREVPCDER